MDIRPLIYDWEFKDSGIFLKLAAGSSENLKPNLVMDTYLSCIFMEDEDGVCLPGIRQSVQDEPVFAYHRLEMYADIGEVTASRLVSLESLGQEI